MTERLHVVIYSDGGSKPNPGPGGWGALVIYPDREQVLSGGLRATTNNQMELTAACEALESLPEACDVTFYTDSTYVRNGITSWLASWKRSGWINSQKEPVANRELWQRLDLATQRHNITWKWVKGHAGNTYNERVDKIATLARAQITGEKVEPINESAPTSHTPTGMVAYLAARHDVKTAGRAVWGVLIIDGDRESVNGGRIPQAESENHAVLLGALRALQALDKIEGLTLYTESEYFQKGISAWVKGWSKNGWVTAKKEPVKYKEVWEKLHTLSTAQKTRVEYAPANKPEMKKAAQHAVKFFWD